VVGKLLRWCVLPFAGRRSRVNVGRRESECARLTGTQTREKKVSTVPTYTPKAGDTTRQWYVIDAQDVVLGRLAVEAAKLLRGKHKPTFTPHVDDGDNVIVINADKVVLTGRKRDQKVYYHHTGYIGGIKERSAKSILEGRFPERVVEKAVERMLPRGPLGRRQLGNLRVYPGPDHPHEAQKPEALDVGAMNRKNRSA